jgi:hypothetical protein
MVIFNSVRVVNLYQRRWIGWLNPDPAAALSYHDKQQEGNGANVILSIGGRKGLSLVSGGINNFFGDISGGEARPTGIGFIGLKGGRTHE